MMSENIPEVMLALQNKLHGRFAASDFHPGALTQKKLFI